jgi:hypothetical protein
MFSPEETAMKRTMNRYIAAIFVLAVGLLILQLGIQLLHHHHDSSCYDAQDGFHYAIDADTCPAKTAQPGSADAFPATLPSCNLPHSPARTLFALRVDNRKLVIPDSFRAGPRNRPPPA